MYDTNYIKVVNHKKKKSIKCNSIIINIIIQFEGPTIFNCSLFNNNLLIMLKINIKL